MRRLSKDLETDRSKYPGELEPVVFDEDEYPSEPEI
jgi:hypothetical protein